MLGQILYPCGKLLNQQNFLILTEHGRIDMQNYEFEI